MRRKTMTVRLLKSPELDGREFDYRFWREAGANGVFEAAWNLVCQVRLFRGDNGPEPRLQRSVCRVVR